MTSDIPYQLRPNKFIDRKLFLEALTRIVNVKGPELYGYVSMGGEHLVDQWSAYRNLGITSLWAFDWNENVVNRQEFNKPFDCATCKHMETSDLPGKLDEISAAFGQQKSLIVWLDYTSAGERLTQIQELIALLKKLQKGDVFRVTMNANDRTLGDSGKYKCEGFEKPSQWRLDKIRKQLGEYVPATLAEVGDNEFPRVLCKAVEYAVLEAQRENSSVRFEPVLSTCYRDGQRMVTVTGLTLDKDEGERANISALESWPFKSTEWTEIVEIQAPTLSMKEKYLLDERLSSEAAQIGSEFKFYFGKDEAASHAAIDNYKKLHRYYPNFLHVELS